MKRLFLLSSSLLITSLPAADQVTARWEEHIQEMQAMALQAENLAERLNQTMHDFKDVVDPLLPQPNITDSHVVPEYPVKVSFSPLSDGQREMHIEYVSEPRIVMQKMPQFLRAMWSSNEEAQHSERLINADKAFLLAWVKEEKATFIATGQAAPKISTDNAIND